MHKQTTTIAQNVSSIFFERSQFKLWPPLVLYTFSEDKNSSLTEDQKFYKNWKSHFSEDWNYFRVKFSHRHNLISWKNFVQLWTTLKFDPMIISRINNSSQNLIELCYCKNDFVRNLFLLESNSTFYLTSIKTINDGI